MKKNRKIIFRMIAVISLLAIIYWAIISFPHFLFKAETVENLTVYHHHDQPDEVREVAARALAKLKKSSFYEPDKTYAVFLTGSAAEYTFFTTYFAKTGGVFLVYANGNILIRPSLIAQDRLISPGGNIVGSDSFNYEAVLENYRQNLPMMNCEKSGLYLKFQLLTEHLIRDKNISKVNPIVRTEI